MEILYSMKEFNPDSLSKYNKALVIAAGGGNDGVNAVPVVSYLNDLGIQCSVVSALNPALTYTFRGKEEEPLNVVDATVKKFYPLRNGFEEKSMYIDVHVQKAMREEGLDLLGYYALSFKFGTEVLIANLKRLVERHEYDLTVLVDCGGDVLFRGVRDSGVLSPSRDAMALAVAERIPTDKYLVLTGVGSDGEMTPEAMNEILGYFETTGRLYGSTEILPDSEMAIKYRDVYGRIKDVRRGNTTRRFLASIFGDSVGDIVEAHEVKGRVRDVKVSEFKNITMPSEHFAQMYWMDLERARMLNPFAFHFDTVLEHFVRAKCAADVNTELDLQYVRLPHIDDPFVQFLTPSLQFSEEARASLINRGLEDLKKGEIDAAIMMNYDITKVVDFDSIKVSNFMVVYNREDSTLAKEIAAMINNISSKDTLF